VPEGERSLRRRIQEQTVRSAREFYGDSLGRLENILQGDRAQLEDLAEQLPEGDAEAQIRDMAGSYSKIEESLHRVARDLDAEDAVSEAARQAQEEAAEEPERAARGARDAAGAAAGEVTGAVGQVGQIAEGAQEAVGQVLDRVGQVAENLPGGRLLHRTTDESGQTLQRAVDGSGVTVEITLDEAGNLVNQKPVGSLAELPAEEEYQTEEGQTIRTVKEESGTLIELRLGEDGSILDLQVLPPSKI
jgi:dsDNA-specific endonuclease/ATPase MutS2